MSLGLTTEFVHRSVATYIILLIFPAMISCGRSQLGFSSDMPSTLLRGSNAIAKMGLSQLGADLSAV